MQCAKKCLDTKLWQPQGVQLWQGILDSAFVLSAVCFSQVRCPNVFVTASACSLWALAPGGHKVVARGSCPTCFADGLVEPGFWPSRRRENADHPQVAGALDWKYVGEPWQLPLLLRPVPEQQFRDRTASWWRTSAGPSHLSRGGAAHGSAGGRSLCS